MINRRIIKVQWSPKTRLRRNRWNSQWSPQWSISKKCYILLLIKLIGATERFRSGRIRSTTSLIFQNPQWSFQWSFNEVWRQWYNVLKTCFCSSSILLNRFDNYNIRVLKLTFFTQITLFKTTQKISSA